MNYLPNPAQFFESEDEDAISVEDDLYKRVDEWLNSQGIESSDPKDIQDDAFDEMRRKTYSEMSTVNGDCNLSAPSTSPFFLCSPLASSIVLERDTALNRNTGRVDSEHGTPKRRPTASKIHTNSSRKVETNRSSSFFPGPVGSPELAPKADLNVKARGEGKI